MAKASPASRATRVAPAGRHAADERCAKPAVEVIAGGESATFSLARCDGGALPAGVDQLSVLARPATAPKPAEPLTVLEKNRGSELAPGIRRLDARLVERLELAIEHFTSDGENDGEPAHVVLVSGIRPRNAGSYHSAGRAIDFRIEGVKNDALTAFCKTLPDTGCGYYPNDVFIHMDVREPGTGHVAWVDASRTGDASRHAANEPGRKTDRGGDAPGTSARASTPREAPRDATTEGENTTRDGSPREAPGAIASRDGVEPGPSLALSRPTTPSEAEGRRGEHEDGSGAGSRLARLPALPDADRTEHRRVKHKHHRMKVTADRHSL